MLIAPPTKPGAPWTAKSDAADRPLREDLTLDANGRLLSRAPFGGRPLLDRVVGTGVAAHEGQLFGLLNQVLNQLIALGLALLPISGAVMWWRRRPADRLGAPPLARDMRVAVGFFLLIGALGIALPLLGLSMLALLLVERLVLTRLPAARHWLGLPTARSNG